jgi:DNA processing protein
MNPRELELMAQQGVTPIAHNDARYPKSLKALKDFPSIIYVKGELLPSDGEGLAIVGTRQCSIYGQEMAQEMASEVAGQGVTVISGLARGIDTAAHRGALKRGRTLAVLGSGFAHLYPKENAQLVEEIAEQGAVISELPMVTPPDKRHFPRRNRLVSALSLGALLIEAPLKSGAMITMEMARKQGKFCFAIPGRIDVESFRGNHFLIKKQRALLVEKAEEMLSILLPGTKNSSCEEKNYFVELSEDEASLLACFPKEEIGFETAALLSNLPIAKLSALLTGLVLKKAIKEFPGKNFKRIID